MSKKKKKAIEKTSRNLVMIVAGIALNAFAVEAFSLPFNILLGGVTGLGRILCQLTPLTLSQSVMIFNLLLLLIALIFLGKNYAGTIVFGSILYPVLLGVFESMHLPKNIVEDPLVACLSGGFLMGVGLGLVIRAGGSLGGSDVISLICHKKFNISVAAALNTFDVLVLFAQSMMATPNEIILGIMTTITYSIVMNRVLLAGGGLVQFLIFSPKNEEIRKVLVEYGFGATVLHSRSGFSGQESNVIISIFSVRFMNWVKAKILEIDDTAFITISSVRQVEGRGFTIQMTKEQQDKWENIWGES
ncbi:MAG: YitT family protein [Anaerovoracaceae bacterium]